LAVLPASASAEGAAVVASGAVERKAVREVGACVDRGCGGGASRFTWATGMLGCCNDASSVGDRKGAGLRVAVSVTTRARGAAQSRVLSSTAPALAAAHTVDLDAESPV